MPRLRLHLDLKAGRSAVRPEVPVLGLIEALCASRHEVCIVDLDAAVGLPSLVAQACARSRPDRLLVAGGVQSASQAEALLELGFLKVVVGSVLVGDDGLRKDCLDAFVAALPPDRWAVALDAWDGHLARHAFRTRTNVALGSALATLLERTERKTDICITDAAAAERTTLPSFELPDCARGHEGRLWLGGGVRTVAEIRAIQARGFGVILGRALFDEGDAFAADVLGLTAGAAWSALLASPQSKCGVLQT